MTKNHLKLGAAALCMAAIFTPAQYADAKNDKARPVIQWDQKGKRDNAVDIRINISDRNIIRDYLQQRYRKNCPPGLAKKNNGCLPPGQAKKYSIGHRLGNDIRIEDLPAILLSRLTAPPKGYRYGMVDQDVVLVSRENRLIVDAVSLLMGN